MQLEFHGAIYLDESTVAEMLDTGFDPANPNDVVEFMGGQRSLLDVAAFTDLSVVA